MSGFYYLGIFNIISIPKVISSICPITFSDFT